MTRKKSKKPRFKSDWKIRNPEKVKESNRRHYLANKEKYLKKALEWNRKNKDLRNQRQRMAYKKRPNDGNSVRAKARKLGFKSGFEVEIARQLEELGQPINYEVDKIPYVVPATKRKYLPDFRIAQNVYIEAKGKFDASERRKFMLLKEQFPDIIIHIAFQNANQKIRKGSKTTYADWCEKHGISWSHKQIKKDWLTKS